MIKQIEEPRAIFQIARIRVHKDRRTVRRLELPKMKITHTTVNSTGVYRNAPRCALNPRNEATRGLQVKRSPSCEQFTTAQMQRMLRTAFRITRNREDAEDAVQDACLQAFVYLDGFDGRSAFSTWLTRIVINSSLMILRKKRNLRISALYNVHDFEDSVERQELRDPASNPEERYLQEERETALRNEIHALRPNLRGAIQFKQLDERSLRETSKKLGLSIGAVKARLFHARRTLRNSRRLAHFAMTNL